MRTQVLRETQVRVISSPNSAKVRRLPKDPFGFSAYLCLHQPTEKMAHSRGTAQWKSPLNPSLLLASLLWILLHDVELGGVCTNPEGIQGTCIEFTSCEPLLKALQVNPRSPNAIDYVRRSFCGFLDRDRLVCCPPDGKQPDFSYILEEATEDVIRHPNLALLRMDICGPVYESAIFIAPSVFLGELPWLALLEYSIKNETKFACGGALINERYVLTAAHCVTRRPRNVTLVSVRLGEYNLTSPIDCEETTGFGDSCSPPPQDIPVERVIPHLKYNGWPGVHDDIALVRLSRPVDFTDEAVRPICLPIEHAQQTLDLVGKYVAVSGWGLSARASPSVVPKKWSVPVISHSQCSQEVTDALNISAVSQICANGARSDCSGDSGGPMTHIGYVQGRRRTIQHGILSYGPRNCGSPFNPGVYTRVGHFMNWILDNIEP